MLFAYIHFLLWSVSQYNPIEAQPCNLNLSFLQAMQINKYLVDLLCRIFEFYKGFVSVFFFWFQYLHFNTLFILVDVSSKFYHVSILYSNFYWDFTANLFKQTSELSFICPNVRLPISILRYEGVDVTLSTQFVRVSYLIFKLNFLRLSHRHIETKSICAIITEHILVLEVKIVYNNKMLSKKLRIDKLN